ncbi:MULTISPECIES: quinone-dependent dihydroorotate dehydrogenase [unclassified Idiomarina]|uniref:quinone-dependent dihydroorotate dehydrogenase n=1 Tax=unclassified Idiomarina TaxID=2614829 RepID=UPI000C8A7710|nr:MULTISPECIES: quinone-dependent dihydroorotate dehydrogenase [unclassified Idiomarina]MAD54608.1 dihydroorotate dehydrogenase (quinone) [Idiomarinaceae bacterium]NQZ04983.1 quinone-dependent dihydroorotate dehydrogenase [Idiomarina sp.]
MYNLVRKWLFNQDAERSHDWTLGFLRRFANTPLSMVWRQKLPAKPVTVMGIQFPNPVGLAAGLDKNARCMTGFGQMGFGFIEVGTVTPKPQPGNPKPRLFRLVKDEAIINRMGFNNDGVDALVEQVKQRTYKGVLGINIGKNKVTEEQDALQDYIACLVKVYPYADYVTINISSPNTPGLRNFQHGDALNSLLAGLKAEQKKLAEVHNKYVPLVVKIAPDLSAEEVRTMAEAFNEQGIDGVIATNTTLSRDGLSDKTLADEAGGLSGKPVRDRSTDVIRLLRDVLDDAIPIIGVGGIDSAAAAKEKLDAGAALVQVYTGFIYKGPKLIKDIVNIL